MITGIPPFYGKTDNDIKKMIMKGEYKTNCIFFSQFHKIFNNFYLYQDFEIRSK